MKSVNEPKPKIDILEVENGDNAHLFLRLCGYYFEEICSERS